MFKENNKSIKLQYFIYIHKSGKLNIALVDFCFFTCNANHQYKLRNNKHFVKMFCSGLPIHQVGLGGSTKNILHVLSCSQNKTSPQVSMGQSAGKLLRRLVI